MEKIIVAMDSFKGSISSRGAVSTVCRELKNNLGQAYEVIGMPLADGGEGSLEVILGITGGNIHKAMVVGPNIRVVEACYGIKDDMAIIEMAESSGLTKSLRLDALRATSYGFGELIKEALDKGARRFYLCIGGSATTDGGCGMAAALGVRFYNIDGQAFIPSGGSLTEIAEIDISELDSRIQESSFKVLSDVTNPLYGENGAAFVYAPQKGANETEVRILNEGLKHYDKKLQEVFGKSFAEIKGAGAAGGMGAGALAFLQAELCSGIGEILKLYDFENEIAGAELVITGEGKLDKQSLMGKVLSGILSSGKGKVVIICGSSELGADEIKEKYNREIQIYELVKEAGSIKEAMNEPEKYIREISTRLAFN